MTTFRSRLNLIYQQNKNFMTSFSALKQASILAILISALLYSCTTTEKDTDNDGIPDKRDSCKTTAAMGTKDGCPIIQQIGKTQLYVETSVSMGGYFKNDAEYKTIISDLAVKVDKEISPLSIYLVADSPVLYPKSPMQFSSDIATTSIANQKSSELSQIISKIASKTKGNDVSIFVSDCILSFPNSVIKKNWEINKTEAPNALKNNIFSTFSDLKKNGLATSVYAFKSKFYGNYYDYHNVKTKLNGESRPFYVWVIANKEILGQFDEKLLAVSSFQPEKALHFGLIDSAVTNFAIIPQVEKAGSWQKDGVNSLKDVELKKDEKLKICLAVNLSSLPAYAREIAYLKDHLQVTSKGCKATFEAKKKEDLNRTKLKSKNQIVDVNSATHGIILEISQMELDKGEVRLTLPLKYDTWYKDWSCMDDRNIVLATNKTFAFEYLIQGVIEAYDTKNKNYVDLLITLNK